MDILINAEKLFSRAAESIFWTRHELGALLSIYGRHVAAGEWCDYGMSGNRAEAIFSIHRRAHERPLYRIEKIAARARKPMQYVIRGRDGQIIRRGGNLSKLLEFFDRRPLKVVR